MTGEGKWGLLWHPGTNGLVTVLICLRWWGKITMEHYGMRSIQMLAWDAAVKDVLWVFNKCIETVQMANRLYGDRPNQNRWQKFGQRFFPNPYFEGEKYWMCWSILFYLPQIKHIAWDSIFDSTE
ncbi:hypothetical protein ARMGADRAFT_1033789 [Armillaria gallica]|uniref:Uncharacterized protein n=1 Tax=Armillaria gallica TaxID=47427 RepID=A0A2H3D0K6_ARMGA|nr:hypothetical protein ARMGADRAFT_1033789 [Armillaria gallica]